MLLRCHGLCPTLSTLAPHGFLPSSAKVSAPVIDFDLIGGPVPRSKKLKAIESGETGTPAYWPRHCLTPNLLHRQPACSHRHCRRHRRHHRHRHKRGLKRGLSDAAPSNNWRCSSAALLPGLAKRQLERPPHQRDDASPCFHLRFFFRNQCCSTVTAAATAVAAAAAVVDQRAAASTCTTIL